MSGWIRSAFWLGQPRAGLDGRFRAQVDEVLIPAMRTFPGVRDARALWPRSREDDPPPLALQVIVEFACRADLDRMLACEERRALRPRVLEAVAMFDGTMSHIDYETAP